MPVVPWLSTRSVRHYNKSQVRRSDLDCPDFSRRDYNGPALRNLLDVIAYVKPTALMGLSTIGVHFHSCNSSHPWFQCWVRVHSPLKFSKRWLN